MSRGVYEQIAEGLREAARILPDLTPSPARNGDPQKKGGLSGDARQKGFVMDDITQITGETTLVRRDPLKIVKPKVAILYAGVCEMDAKEWAEVLDNPRQRDTASHARRASHLMVPHPAHAKVNMARLPDGRLYKLDGHTRSFMWQAGTVAPPELLYVDVWDCLTLEDAKTLYGTFDSRGAVETTGDQVFGALREQSIAFESDYLKTGKYAASMRVAYECLYGGEAARGITVYDLLKFWKRDLALLDSCKPTSKRFHTGIAAASILSIHRFGVGALDFWGKFARGEGSKSEGVSDPIQALEERMERRRNDGALQGRGNHYEIIGIAISAMERHRQHKNYSTSTGGGIKATTGNSFKEWMIEAKNARRFA